MEDQLYEKLENEMKEYKEKVKEKGLDYAMDKAYEMTVKQEIIDSIEYDHELSKTEIKALLSRLDKFWWKYERTNKLFSR